VAVAAQDAKPMPHTAPNTGKSHTRSTDAVREKPQPRVTAPRLVQSMTAGGCCSHPLYMTSIAGRCRRRSRE
jgi:hypothetical protein